MPCPSRVLPSLWFFEWVPASAREAATDDSVSEDAADDSTDRVDVMVQDRPVESPGAEKTPPQE